VPCARSSCFHRGSLTYFVRAPFVA
jgi:hypothetical protein